MGAGVTGAFVVIGALEGALVGLGDVGSMSSGRTDIQSTFGPALVSERSFRVCVPFSMKTTFVSRAHMCHEPVLANRNVLCFVPSRTNEAGRPFFAA